MDVFRPVPIVRRGSNVRRSTRRIILVGGITSGVGARRNNLRLKKNAWDSLMVPGMRWIPRNQCKESHVTADALPASGAVRAKTRSERIRKKWKLEKIRKPRTAVWFDTISYHRGCDIEFGTITTLINVLNPLFSHRVASPQNFAWADFACPITGSNSSVQNIGHERNTDKANKRNNRYHCG